MQFFGRPNTSLVTVPTGLCRLLLFRWASPYVILMPVVSSFCACLIHRPVGLQSDTTLGHLSSPVLFICFIERMIQELLLVLGSVYCGSKILVSITHVYTYIYLHIFRTCPDRPCGPPSLLYNGYRVSFPVVKRPGSGVDLSPHLTPKLNKE